MSEVIFVTYASSNYRKNIFWNKLFVKLFIRPDKAFFYTDDDLKKSATYKDNRVIFDAVKGGGYWAWKPWVILQAIESANEGDIVLYQDCGKGFKYKNFKKPVNIIKYALDNGAMPGVLVPIHGKNKQWTHSKCFELMGCCEERYYESAQVEATVSAWKVGEKSKGFVGEWFSYCLKLDVVGDVPADCPEPNDYFSFHRYDQSVLTNLVLKRELKPVRLSFDDIHFSKSLSLVDLELGKREFLNKVILNVVLRLFRFIRNLKKDKRFY